MANIKENFNLFTFGLILLATLFAFWLFTKKTDVGNIFFGLMMFGITMTTIGFIFVQTNNVNFPITKSYIKAITIFFTLLLLPILLFSITQFNVSKVMIPMLSNSISEGTVFSSIQASNDPFWQLNTYTILAGVLEEFIFGFVAVILGMIIGKMIRKLSNIEWGMKKNYWFDLAIGFIVSIIFFMIMHGNNATYTSAWMFITAGLFRLFLNVAIWIGGIPLAGAIGYHLGNNLIYFASVQGWNTVFQALFSFKGVTILILLTLAIFFLIMNIKKVDNVWKEIFEKWTKLK